jgi:hypothetical protein
VVDGGDLALGVHRDVETLPEEIGLGNQKLFLVLDYVPDVIGQATVRE